MNPPLASKKSGALRRWLRRAFIAAVVTAAFLLIAGLVFQRVATARERAASRPPGKLYDVGGRQMHFYCTGAESGPTVVLMSGLGDDHSPWQQVQPEIAKVARVCSYDRAGLGWSDASPESPTAEHAADDLNHLLQTAKIDGPLVLVAHSLSGLHARVFARRFPELVRAMVLVDSSHPEQAQRMPWQRARGEQRMAPLRWQRYVTYLGVQRLMGMCDSPPSCRSEYPGTVYDEWLAFQESGRQAAAAGSLGDMPLVVVSRDPAGKLPGMSESEQAETQRVWAELQRELVSISSRGRQVVAERSGHYVQRERPELVVEAVRSVLQEPEGK